MSEKVFEFDIVLEETDFEPVLQAAKEAGAQDAAPVRPKGLVGVEWLVVGSLALPMLVNLLMKLAELWPVGVRIDMRTERVRTTRDPELPRGSVLVVTAEGSKLHRVGEMKLPDLSKAIAKMLGLG